MISLPESSAFASVLVSPFSAFSAARKVYRYYISKQEIEIIMKEEEKKEK